MTLCKTYKPTSEYSWNIIRYNSLESTNIEAIKLVNEGYGSYTVVLAEDQLNGFGKSNREWYSDSRSSLTFSIILDLDKIDHDRVSSITIAVAVAVCRCLRENYTIDAVIKWPNDVLLNGRKLSGILSEMVINKSGKSLAIIGIGLNVNQVSEDFPNEIKELATSLNIEQKSLFDKAKLLKSILDHIHDLYELLHIKSTTVIEKEFNRLSCVVSQTKDIRDGLLILKEVKIKFINKSGFLVVEDIHGNEQELFSGEI